LENSLFLDGRPAERLQLLIAEDIQETRRNTRMMLGMNPDIEVVAVARNGQQSIDLAQQHKPDLVIMDINMPDIDGLTAFKRIKEINADIECIVISAQKDNQTLRDAMAAGAREYLIKPFTVDELNLAVYRVGQLIIKKRKGSLSVMDTSQLYEADLEALAADYAKSRRTDPQALRVFERLAADPDCDLRWLRILAMIYVVRQEWGKLKGLAERLDRQEKSV
jgi:YesN/AraC family two-component response regulator